MSSGVPAGRQAQLNEEARQRREQVAKLRSQGVEREGIAARLGLRPKTVTRIITALQKDAK